MQRYSFISRTMALSFGSYAQSLMLRAYERLLPVRSIGGHVLIVQLGQIGDFVLTMPLIEALKEKHGGSLRISVLIDSINSGLAGDCGGIDAVYEYDSKKYSRAHEKTVFPGTALTNSSFDCALWLRGDGSTFRWLAANRIPVRSVARFPNPMRSSWLSLMRNGLDEPHGDKNTKARYPHFVDSIMEIGGIERSEPEREARPSKMGSKAVDEGTGERVFIHIGSGGELRRWPEERFAELSLSLLGFEGRLNIILIGAKPDYERADRIIRRIKHTGGRVANGCGSFELADLKTVFQRGALYIGLDSGPMHIAASTGIPVVALMGPQSPDVFGPMGESARVVYKAYPCSPCWQFACVRNPGGGAGRCISDITAEEVFTEAKALLKGGTTVEKDTAPLQCLLG
ncbi:MAG: glycosyltransferase family 9 protein [Deltaproteobacteria bacterium]|nr:glycosyltransferase family 9 protein [Deltaproteobacteria bacterium]